MDFSVLSNTVRLGGLYWTLMLAKLCGINEITVLTLLSISPTQFRNPETYVHIDKMNSLHDAILARCNNSIVSLSSNIPLGEFGLLDYICSTALTVKIGFERLQQYYFLLNQIDRTFHFKTNDNGGAITIKLNRTIPESLAWYYTETIHFSFTHILSRIRLLTNKSITPISVHFVAPRGKNHTELLKLFDCDIHYDSNSNTIMFDHDVLNMQYAPIVNTELHQIICKLADNSKTKHSQELQLKSKVKQILLDYKPNQKFSQAKILDELNITQRTLHRKLEKEGTSYTEIRDKMIVEKTIGLLYDHEKSINDISILMGYSSINTFYRTFKRLTGVSPLEYRNSKII